MKKIALILVLIIVLIIGVIGIFSLTYNSLENSTVELPDGWKKLNVKDNFQTPNTLHYDYVPARNDSIFNKSDIYVPVLTAQINDNSEQEFNEIYDASKQNSFDDEGIEYRYLEAKNITIEGIIVKYVKNILYNIKDKKIEIIGEQYFFQKGNKYYIVNFVYTPSNPTTSTENPYKTQIDEAVKSIIKTI